MSCQQASRFHSAAAATTTSTAIATATKQAAAALAKIATTTAATTKRIATTAAATTTLTPVDRVAGKLTTTTPPEDLDPYAFTETIAVAPPILFNAQKSRARLNEHNSKSNITNNNNNNKRPTTAGAANRKANLVAQQLNATAAAATTTKAQASLATTLTATTPATTTTTTTTNFNNVTQSQSQPRQPPTLSQLQLQSQSQASSTSPTPKRATNVCIVRPQQQEKLTGLGQQHQILIQPQPCQPQPSASVLTPPPPLYTHTPSLWQTPLILDTNQKLQQQHQQQQHPAQQQQQPVIALVSPPTSPASLPSPTLPHNAAAVTAMVAPIVSPKGGGLPPSKFHHNTLAQHLQKVECLKKKKSLPLVCQNNNNNNNVVESLNKPTAVGGGLGNYSLKQPPPLTVFNTGQVQAVPISKPAHPPPVTGQRAPHSISSNASSITPTSSSSMDDSDLNEIPVNVIFRKPPVLMAGTGAGAVTGTDSVGGCQGDVKIVTPLTPPTPPTPPLLANLLPQQTVVSGGIAPALNMRTAVPPLLPPMSSASAPTPAPLPIKTEQKSSKVANGNVAINATPKRQTPQAAAGAKNGNNKLNNTSTLAKMSPSPLALPSVSPIQTQVQEIPIIKTERSTSIRRRRCKPTTKRCLTSSENEAILSDVPYCLQQHWLHSSSGKELCLEVPLSPSNRREERIAVRKGLLRRQALQLLSTRSLQEIPMQAARQRLQCVQTLLVKYKDHAAQQQPIGIGNRCLVANCKEPTLSMAAHCERHIVNNTTQQLFRPCMAWRMDGTACQSPVFDVLHTLTLCSTHNHLRAGLDVARQPPKQVTLAGGATASMVPAVAADTIQAAGRKRKPNANPVNRPQKRARKQPEQVVTTTTTLPLVMSSAVLQRKSSTTSLESIASNSQSSGNSHSQLPYTPHQTTPTSTSASAIINAPAPASLSVPHLSLPPALAPLSGDYHHQHHQQPQQLQQQLLVPKFESEEQHMPLIKFEAEQQHLDNSFNLLANANIKAEEISQIVAQLAAADSDLHHNNNSLHFNHNTNSNHNNNSLSYSNNNSISSQGDSISFPSFNTAFGNAMGNHQTITHNGVNRNVEQLGNTASLLGQDLFGVCDNSSAYASSEDTGLGGLSESELMGANDADDMALNGAHLLEEHDLVNVFDTLPDDAFNELFQSVQQAECEAMDRALEIADKNLKCLQQTIGGSGDSAFLNDFLDVSDDLLSVMNSPNTSGIDASTIVDNSNSSNGPNNCAPAGTVLDIRGLVQT